MVKNTQGGSKHKSLARKDYNLSEQHIRLSQHRDECYAKVSKMLGNGMCLVDIILDNFVHHDIVCHIRGKFRNKHKKNNMVSLQSFLLVGIREWTNQLNACDLLFVYSHHHINSLPISLLNYNHNNLDDQQQQLFSDSHTTNSPLTPSLPTLDNHNLNHNLNHNDNDIDFLLLWGKGTQVPFKSLLEHRVFSYCSSPSWNILNEYSCTFIDILFKVCVSTIKHVHFRFSVQNVRVECPWLAEYYFFP